MYADDAILYCNILKTVRTAKRPLIMNYQTYIHLFKKLTSNKLSLNIKNTKFMLFQNTKKKVEYPDLTYMLKQFEKNKQLSFLDLHINKNLTWDAHIKHISLKNSKIIFTINRRKHIYPHIIHNIYNTLILHHLNYCVIILYLLKKKVMRIITCSWYRAHIEPIFKTLHVLKMHDI